MIKDDLKQRIEKLNIDELDLVKYLIFHYNNFNVNAEMKAGYRIALHHVFQILDIASIADIDMRPIVEQQIDKIVDSISEIEKKLEI
jgi:hypothetical protein